MKNFLSLRKGFVRTRRHSSLKSFLSLLSPREFRRKSLRPRLHRRLTGDARRPQSAPRQDRVAHQVESLPHLTQSYRDAYFAAPGRSRNLLTLCFDFLRSRFSFIRALPEEATRFLLDSRRFISSRHYQVAPMTQREVLNRIPSEISALSEILSISYNLQRCQPTEISLLARQISLRTLWLLMHSHLPAYELNQYSAQMHSLRLTLGLSPSQSPNLSPNH